ncbi:MAG TPA: helix-turn-helix transcriptional regulator [Actinomycetes bacterium]|nr:helix-turn-helix transcriptional regulator [Actinomycetes bacterium]
MASTSREQLGKRLRQLRQGAGLSGDALAFRAGWSQAKVSRIERGKTLPSRQDVELWAQHTAAGRQVAAELLELLETTVTTATAWRTLHRLGLRHRQVEIAERERQATAISVFQPTMVPGLAQTAEYAKRVMSQGNPSERQDIAAAVEARLERQRILYDESRQLEFLITEGALRWRPGPRQMMRFQYERIAQLATLSNVLLEVVPQDIEAPDAFLHPFVIFEGAEPVVSVETYTAELLVTDPDDIDIYRRTMDRLRAVALSGDGAIHLVRGLYG